MKVTATPDRLEVTHSGTGALGVGLAILAVLLAQWWLVPSVGGLSTLVLVIGAGVAALITLAALGRARITADRTTGELTLARKTPFGSTTETHPLASLRGAEVTSRKSAGSSPAYRCELLLASGQRWPLSRSFGPAAPARPPPMPSTAGSATPRRSPTLDSPRPQAYPPPQFHRRPAASGPIGARPGIAIRQRVAPTGALRLCVRGTAAPYRGRCRNEVTMFESLSERLGGVFDRLTKSGALSEADVITALREVRVALLEADVSLPVARDFIKRVQDKATGAAVTKSVTPGQMVVKIVMTN